MIPSWLNTNHYSYMGMCLFFSGFFLVLTLFTLIILYGVRSAKWRSLHWELEPKKHANFINDETLKEAQIAIDLMGSKFPDHFKGIFFSILLIQFMMFFVFLAIFFQHTPV